MLITFFNSASKKNGQHVSKQIFKGTRKHIMALLTRFIKLNDEEDSHVFTFLVTKSVTKSAINRDVISKDFVYGFHRWAVSFSKEDKVNKILLFKINNCV